VWKYIQHSFRETAYRGVDGTVIVTLEMGCEGSVYDPCWGLVKRVIISEFHNNRNYLTKFGDSNYQLLKETLMQTDY
jgi:hypothetical protein